VPSGLNIPARPGQRRRRGQLRANELKSKKKIIAKDVSEIYHVGSEVMVQVTKGPISNKGPRIATNISLAGRYLVLEPFKSKL
jgi:Ribonuclease G/E